MDTAKLPKQIFHYTSAGGLAGILSSGVLYFTDSLFLNDRNEQKNFYLQLRQYLKEASLEKELREEAEMRYFGENRPSGGEKLRYFVLSCCREKDSLPMWNYYTRSIRAAGYNIHFDTEELIRQLDDHPMVRRAAWEGRVMCGEVIYKKEEKRKELDRIFRQILPGQKDFWARLDRIFEERSLFYKDRAFSHEKEIRLVLAVKNSKILSLPEESYQFREVRGIQVPALAVDVLEKGRAITGVTAGPALDKQMAVRGVEHMLYYYGFPQTCKVSSVPLRY